MAHPIRWMLALAFGALSLGALATTALAGGDDYELVFTAPPAQRNVLAALAGSLQLPLTRVATIEAAPGLRLVDAQGHAVAHDFASFDHFAVAGGLL